jgi:adenylyl-sulfate kinase
MTANGATVWLTGIPASGKSAIARTLCSALLERGIAAELLDGSEVRESLSRGLGFGREDREEHVRRMGYVAKLLSRNGVIVVCAAVSPYRATREEVRRNTTSFVEVFVDCPVAVAESRDESGAYDQARAGSIAGFTGVSAPYEAPESPEVHVHSDRETVAEAAWKVLRTLELMGIIPATPASERAEREDEIRRRLAALGYV